MTRELRYSANVEWFLNDIAAVEMSDIDSGEFEIYGEDEAGREACTYIDITELAADAAQLISELRDQLQAAEHLAELRGRQGLDTQKKLDALAAENAALKSIVECVNSELYGKGFEVAGLHLNGDLEPLDNWFTDNGWGIPETPATNAYLNSVRAEAVESFAQQQRGIADALTGHGSQRSHRITACRAEDFAAQLRAVKDGE